MHPVIKYCFVVAIGLSASAALAETLGTIVHAFLGRVGLLGRGDA